MTQSFDNFDKPYRRGLVLGLSLAEVFLILLFLLLLAAIGLTSSLQEELNDTENKRQELQDSLDAFREVIGNKITVEEFTRLQKNAAARQKLIRENQALSDQLAAVEKALAKVNDVIEVLKKNNIKPGDLKNIIEGKDTLAEALSKKASIEEKLKEIVADLEDQIVSRMEVIVEREADRVIQAVQDANTNNIEVVDAVVLRVQDGVDAIVGRVQDGVVQRMEPIVDAAVLEADEKLSWHITAAAIDVKDVLGKKV